MALSKYILKEVSSVNDKDTIHKNVFILSQGLKFPNHPTNIKLWETLKEILDKYGTNVGNAGWMTDFESLSKIINLFDDTLDEKYIQWFLFCDSKNKYSWVETDSYARIFMRQHLKKLYRRMHFYMQEHNKPEYKKYIDILKELHDEYEKNRNFLSEKITKYVYYVIERDISTINKVLTWHDKLKDTKNFPQEYKDINNIKSFDELIKLYNRTA